MDYVKQQGLTKLKPSSMNVIVNEFLQDVLEDPANNLRIDSLYSYNILKLDRMFITYGLINKLKFLH